MLTPISSPQNAVALEALGRVGAEVTFGAWLAMAVKVAQPSETEGDVTGDGTVGIADLLDVISTWGRCPCCRSDINGDGSVDISELLNVISNWGD